MVIDLYSESLLVISAVPAFVALSFVDGKIPRFGLGFYMLFSCLVIFALGEPISAIAFLMTLGIASTVMLAFLEERCHVVAHAYVDAKFKFKLSLVTVVSIVAFLISKQLACAISLSVIAVGLVTIGSSRPLRSVAATIAIEGAVFIILAQMELFTTAIALVLCPFTLIGNSVLGYAVANRSCSVEKP